MVSQRIFPVGRPYTFVIAGCPVDLTWTGCSFELRPRGEIWRGNAIELGRIFGILLDAGQPVTLLLAELHVVDEAGAEVIGHSLAAARAVGVAWIVRETPRGCRVDDGVSGAPGVGPARDLAGAAVGGP